MSTLKAGSEVILPFFINQTDLLAPTVQDLVSPIDGFIEEFQTTVQAAVTTGGTLTVKTGDALATTVAGLTQTIENSATKGTRQRTVSTTGSTTRAVAKGDRIGIEPQAAFDTAGAVSGWLVIRSADMSPAMDTGEYN